MSQIRQARALPDLLIVVLGRKRERVVDSIRVA